MAPRIGRIQLALTLVMGSVSAICFGATSVTETVHLLPRNETTSTERGIAERGDGVKRITDVSDPTIDIYPVHDAQGAKPAVLVCPGGGYRILAISLEGTEIAEWLNSMGIAAAVLKYRVPDNRAGALEDGRRALQILRERAKDWNLDPRRIGVIGFSAGGHLAARLSTSGAERPDFAILVYPAYLGNQGELAKDVAITSGTPPTFLVQTQDDHKFVQGTIAYYTALTAAKIPAEIHLFAKGGHGYGLRRRVTAVSEWPSLCARWLKDLGLAAATQDD